MDNITLSICILEQVLYHYQTLIQKYVLFVGLFTEIVSPFFYPFFYLNRKTTSLP